ncbi:MAG: integrase [Nitrosospira sp.]|nr:integrase [Nitrosospira sp.]
MKNTVDPRFIGGPYSSAGTDEPPWYRSRRFSIFIIVFLISATAGLAYNYSRPAIYRSSATLLTSAMTAIDRESGEPDVQHVAIQRQFLLGHELVAETLSRLKTSATDKSLLRLTTADIQNLLQVEPVAETNLVEIQAEGSDPKFLPVLINTWIDVYLGARSEEVKQLTSDTTRIIEDELEGLAGKVESARAELEAYRKKHDISSTGREENEALARLKGLTDSLNKASEDEVKARSKVAAVRFAISRGKTVVPDDEKGSLVELELRSQDLREKLAQLDKKFTREYINLHPEFKFIPEQISELETAIKRKRRDGGNVVLADAEVTYAAAQQTVREIRGQLDEHKHLASAFTTKFARHDALQADLESLEKLYRETQDRLVQVSAGRKEKYPQVTVISRAHEPRDPVRPDYGRDALIAIVSSLLLGLFSVWIFEYLTRKKEEQQPPVAIFGIHNYPSAGADLVNYSQATLSPPDHKTTNALASPSHANRELSSHQLRILLNAANLKGKQLISLLLSGLSIDEAAFLQPDRIDLETATLTVAERAPRTISMSNSLKSLLEQSGGYPAWNPDDPGLRIDLSAALVCAAVDSGLPDPEGITAETIRHSYIAYLVRQGLRLSDLEQIAGYLEPSVISSYSAYSPPQQGRQLCEIELLHPALMNGA